MRGLAAAITAWILASHVLPAPGLAEPPACANLSGTWVLDKKASESMDALMAAEGIPALERRIYGHLGVTLEIEQSDPKEVRIRAISSLATDEEILRTDGTPQSKEVPYLGEVTFRSNWTDAGRVLLTVTDLKASDGSPAQATMKRWLTDQGNSLHSAVSLKLSDGKELAATRIFRRRKDRFKRPKS